MTLEGLRHKTFIAKTNAAQLQQPEVADPFELGSLCDDDLKETCPVVVEVKGLQYNLSCGNELVRVGTKTEDIDLGTKPQATCKAPKSKATKATVKKGASFKSLESPKPFVGLGACPDIAQQCLDDPRWKRVFLPTLSHAFYITDHPFTNWIWESNTLLQTVQIVFNLSFPNISYMLSVQDKVVKATRRSKIASDVLLLVKTFFEGTEFRNRPERIKEHVRWALRFGGGAYYETPVPKSCTLKPNDPGCPKPDGFLCSQFILPVAKTYVNFAEKSVLHPSLGPRNPPKGLYAMVLTAVERAMRAHMTGAFHAPGDFNHQITWNSMKDFYKILDQVRESHWAQALKFDDFDDTESGADKSFLPLIGGVFSSPQDRWPHVSSHPFWADYPNFLPCLVAAIFVCLSLVITGLYLEETLDSRPSERLRLASPNSDSLQREAGDSPALDMSSNESDKPLSLRSVLTRPAVVTIANYTLFAMLSAVVAVYIPLVWSTPVEYGGLNLDPASIGLVLSVYGGMGGFFQFVFFSHFISRFDLRLVAYGGPNFIIWLFIILQMSSLCIFNMGYSAMNIYISSAAPNKRSLSTVYGLSHAATLVTSAVGQVAAGWLFAFSLTHNVLGGKFAYVVFLGVVCIELGVSTRLPKSTWAHREE
ncbi:hypothetical protein EDB83DRAFT_2681535 [Lactarius deliciosus]|nr:hypothetical protein EDB83DRAFT_2681535 [Lactarius deliciosus]